VYADAGSLLGRTVAGVVHVVDPDALIVLGEGTSAWRHWEATFTKTLRRHLMPSRRGLPVRVEQWNDEKWAVGAASLVLFSPLDATGASGAQGRAVRARLHHSLSAEAGR
jgi:predicted NBD/HSP70 family sugar kinase